MQGNKNPSPLRQLARTVATHGDATDISSLSQDDVRQLVYEFGVYQAELLAQNEALLELRQELELSRDAYATLYDLAPVGYATLDAHGRILSCNLTLGVLLQTPRSLLEGRSLVDCIIPHHRAAFRQLLASTLEDEAVRRCDVSMHVA